jgi:hypothetical protein
VLAGWKACYETIEGKRIGEKGIMVADLTAIVSVISVFVLAPAGIFLFVNSMKKKELEKLKHKKEIIEMEERKEYLKLRNLEEENKKLDKIIYEPIESKDG